MPFRPVGDRTAWAALDVVPLRIERRYRTVSKSAQISSQMPHRGKDEIFIAKGPQQRPLLGGSFLLRTISFADHFADRQHHADNRTSSKTSRTKGQFKGFLRCSMVRPHHSFVLFKQRIIGCGKLNNWLFVVRALQFFTEITRISTHISLHLSCNQFSKVC
ncbi:hypothetical protein D3C75_907310 [compost metagenome]